MMETAAQGPGQNRTKYRNRAGGTGPLARMTRNPSPAGRQPTGPGKTRSGTSGMMGPMENQAPPEPDHTEAPVTREILLDETVSPAKATSRIQIRRIRIASGYPAGPHIHNGPVFGSIETGSAVYQIAGGEASVLRPGDVFYEPEGTVIEKFDATQEGVTFLGFFPVADGEEPEIKPAT